MLETAVNVMAVGSGGAESIARGGRRSAMHVLREVQNYNTLDSPFVVRIQEVLDLGVGAQEERFVGLVTQLSPKGSLRSYLDVRQVTSLAFLWSLVSQQPSTVTLPHPSDTFAPQQNLYPTPQHPCMNT